MEVISPVEVFRTPRKHEGGIAVGPADKSYRAFEVLYLGFIAMPIITGLGMLFNVLAAWRERLALELTLDGRWTAASLKGLGVAELALGVFVAVNPRVGALAVMGWLWLGALNSVIKAGHWGLMVCLLTLSAGAFALSELAQEFGKRPSS